MFPCFPSPPSPCLFVCLFVRLFVYMQSNGVNKTVHMDVWTLVVMGTGLKESSKNSSLHGIHGNRMKHCRQFTSLLVVRIHSWLPSSLHPPICLFIHNFSLSIHYNTRHRSTHTSLVTQSHGSSYLVVEDNFLTSALISSAREGGR